MFAVVFALVAAPNGIRAGGDDDHAHAGPAHRAKLVPLGPGTLVEDQPPRGWSHLVIKSRPYVASGDLETLLRSAFRTAALIRTVILADVGPRDDDPRRFVLRRVGIGLCIPNPARGDVVVDSGRLGELGVRLGLMEKIVLQSAEAEVAQGRLIASTPTFALNCGPTILQMGQAHQKVELSYAFLVDQQSGDLRVLVWPQAARRGGPAAPARLLELRPNLLFDCPLNVKAKRLLGTVPTSWSFAMESLPPGQPRPISPALGRYLAGDTQPRDPEWIEQALQSTITGRQAPAE
jgi:hypothetical protein